MCKPRASIIFRNTCDTNYLTVYHCINFGNKKKRISSGIKVKGKKYISGSNQIQSGGSDDVVNDNVTLIILPLSQRE